MKKMMTVAIGLLITGTSYAAQPFFTAASYKQVKQDTGVEFRVSKSAYPGLNAYRTSCAKAALASLAHATFHLAEQRGVDYPETIFVDNVKITEYMPGQLSLQIYSDKKIFSVPMDPQVTPCIAYEATVSPGKINLNDLRRQP